MSLATSFAKRFAKEYASHRWPTIRGRSYSSAVWTREMGKILAKTALRMGLSEKRDELKRVDFTWYRRNQKIPAIVLEHENAWGGVFAEEVPKLLASNADLKVLVCYPPLDDQDDAVRELHKILRDSDRIGKLSEEFLLIMGHPDIHTNDKEEFTFCWLHQDYTSDLLALPWFAEGREIYWEEGHDWAYRARVLGWGKNTVKLEIIDKAWNGKHIQVVPLAELAKLRD